MKKFRAIVLAMLVVFAVNSSVLAAGFSVVETSPKDGATDIPLENMGVKVRFSKDVYSEENKAINEKAYKLLDNKGKEVKSMIVFNEKEKDIALILATPDAKIKPVAKYSLEIDKSFVATDGSTLGKDEKVTFKTLNPKTTMKISMGMMAVMIIGMVFFSSKAMKKQQQGEAKEKEQKVNPYKVAKQTGKSVTEVIAEEQKKKAKAAAKKAKEGDDFEEEYEEELEIGHFRVKTKRTVKEGGSTYITGRKAEAEAKKAAAEAKKAKGKKNNKGGRKKKR